MYFFSSKEGRYGSAVSNGANRTEVHSELCLSPDYLVTILTYRQKSSWVAEPALPLWCMAVGLPRQNRLPMLKANTPFPFSLVCVLGRRSTKPLVWFREGVCFWTRLWTLFCIISWVDCGDMYLWPFIHTGAFLSYSVMNTQYLAGLSASFYHVSCPAHSRHEPWQDK